jgi:hypothetical protein
VVVYHGDLTLSVDGHAVDLPFSPRDPAWAIAWTMDAEPILAKLHHPTAQA